MKESTRKIIRLENEEWVIVISSIINRFKKKNTSILICKKKEVKEEEEKCKLHFTLLVAKSNPTPSKQTWSKPPSPVVQSWTGNSPPK